MQHILSITPPFVIHPIRLFLSPMFGVEEEPHPSPLTVSLAALTACIDDLHEKAMSHPPEPIERLNLSISAIRTLVQ